MKQCMGGWCARREKCPHYWAPKGREMPAERLCIPGRDDVRLLMASAFRNVELRLFPGPKADATEGAEVPA